MNREDVSIVIVDDMQFSRALMKSYLSKAGFTDIRLEASVKQALDAIKERKADVIVADWVMPEMTGLDLVDHIRVQEQNQDHYTSVLLFTAREGVEALVEAFEHGVDDYLQKPINSDELVARVLAAARHAYLQNQLHATSRELREANRAYRIQTGMYDKVTGLGNQASMHERLDPVLKEIAERGGCVGMLMIQVANLDDVREVQGDDIGKEMLSRYGELLEDQVRPTDIVSRLSDDEFAVAIRLPAGINTLNSVIARLKETQQDISVKTSAGYVPVKVKMAHVTYEHPEKKPSTEELVARVRSIILNSSESA